MEEIMSSKVEFEIQTADGDKGFFSWLKVKGIDPMDVSNCRGDFSRSGWSYLAAGPQGKWSPTLEKSIDVVRKTVLRQIKSLESHRDPRPSQVRRLELLKSWIGQ